MTGIDDGPWSDSSRGILAIAKKSVSGRRDWLVTDLDLLDAMLTADPSTVKTLSAAGINVAALRERVRSYVNLQPNHSVSATDPESPLYGRAASAVLGTALRFAREAGQRHVHPAHLLSALAAGNGTTSILLLEAGLGESAIGDGVTAGSDVRDGRANLAVTSKAPKQSLQKVLRPKNVHPSYSLVRTISSISLIGIGMVIRRNLQLSNGALTMAVFLPGALGLIGTRTYVARLTGIRYNVGPFTWPGRVDIDSDGDGGSLAWRRVATRLIPHGVLLIVGTLLLTPFFVNYAAFSIVPLPGFSRSLKTLFSDEIVDVATADLLGNYEPLDILRLWVGASCWFWSAPAYEVVRSSRDDLEAPSKIKGPKGKLASIANMVLAVPAGILRVLKPLDEVFLWSGANVIIATGPSSSCPG